MMEQTESSSKMSDENTGDGCKNKASKKKKSKRPICCCELSSIDAKLNPNTINLELMHEIFASTLNDIKKSDQFRLLNNPFCEVVQQIFDQFKVSLFDRIKSQETGLILPHKLPDLKPKPNVKSKSEEQTNSLSNISDLDVDEISNTSEDHDETYHENNFKSTNKEPKTSFHQDDFNNVSDNPEASIRIPDIDKLIEASNKKRAEKDIAEDMEDTEDIDCREAEISSNDKKIDDSEDDLTEKSDNNDLDDELSDIDLNSIPESCAKKDETDQIHLNQNDQKDMDNIDMDELFHTSAAEKDLEYLSEVENLNDNDEEKVSKKTVNEAKLKTNNENESDSDSKDKNANEEEEEEETKEIDQESGDEIVKFAKYDSLIKEANKVLNEDSNSDLNVSEKTSDGNCKLNESLDDDINKNAVRKKRKKVRILSSSDENEDSEFELNEDEIIESDKNDEDEDIELKSSSRNLSSESMAENLDDEISVKKKAPKKRKRIMNLTTSSEDQDGKDDKTDRKKKKIKKSKTIKGEEYSDSDEEVTTRKKLHNIYSKDRLRDETREAEKAERERKKRIEEKQKLYNCLQELASEQEAVPDRLILDIDKETKKVLVEVDQKFTKCMKPHQVNGVKFMFNCIIETVDRLRNHGHQSGCILAHSMGLGKTFQVVTLLHTIATNPLMNDMIKKVLIIVPLNVAINWQQEFKKWFDECDIEDQIDIHEMVKVKTLPERMYMLKKWHKHGGILIMTINLFSQLISGKKLSKKVKRDVQTLLDETLLDPGPDLVIVDEGHLLKNDKTCFNHCVSRIKTLRRIILTGTPLQNNLSEYYVMVNFVKPNLLGNKKEFKNRFENPIINGQHIDSTEHDVKVMKKRVHILHKILQNCIHRCAYGVLAPYLQPKFEFVLSIRLTEVQLNLYRYYLNNMTEKTGHNLLGDYSTLSLIWNHPATLIETSKRKQEEEYEADSLKDFVVESNDENSSDENTSKKDDLKEEIADDNLDESGSDIECVYSNKPDSVPQRLLRSQGKAPEIKENGFIFGREWWQKFISEQDAYCIEMSSKFIILFSILEQCEILGDKVLVFSNSLTTLDLIERMLRLKMEETNEKFGPDIDYNELVQKNGGVSHRWIRSIDYFRIDGNVRCEDRFSRIGSFNNEDDHRARLMLVSTRAGGLGINLVGANRCIIFDVSWNPSLDSQAIYRVYRYGQKKPVYVYRFTSAGTMENKIYDRQIIKQSMARRVVDEQQITRYFSQSELAELYKIPDYKEIKQQTPDVPKDRLLADLFLKYKELIISYHEHDSLLENRPEEDLTEEERKAAWAEYENPPTVPQIDEAQLKSLIMSNPQIRNNIGPLLSQLYPKMNPNLYQSHLNHLITNNNPATILSHNQRIASTSLMQQNQSLLQNINNHTRNDGFYQNQYEKLDRLAPINNQFRHQIMKASQNAPVMEPKIPTIFEKVLHYFYSSAVNLEKYLNCSSEDVMKEFRDLFKIESNEPDGKLHYLCYLFVLQLSLKNAADKEPSERISEIMTKFKIENQLQNVYDDMMFYVQYRSALNQQKPANVQQKDMKLNRNHNLSQQHQPVPSNSKATGPIEVIDLDSDDEDEMPEESPVIMKKTDPSIPIQ